MGKYASLFSSIEQQSQQPDTYLDIDKPSSLSEQQPEPVAINEPAPSRSVLKDAAGLWGIGAGSLVQGAGWLFNSDEMQRLGQSTIDYWERTLSDTQRDANQKRFVNDDWSIGEGATDLNTIFGSVVQSLPHMVPGVGAAGLTGRGLLSLGASRGAASFGAAAAGSAGEGVTIGAMVGQEVDQAIRGMSEEDKLQSPYYADLRKLYSEDEATQRLSDMAANPAALKSGAVGAALGVAFNKFLGDALTKQLSGGVVREGVKGGLIEGGTEVLQSGYEAHSRQSALNEYAGQPMSYTGIVNEMVAGLAAGTAMGATVGAAGGLQGSTEDKSQSERQPNTAERVSAARAEAAASGGDALDSVRAGTEELLRDIQSRPEDLAFDQAEDVGGLLSEARREQARELRTDIESRPPEPAFDQAQPLDQLLAPRAKQAAPIDIAATAASIAPSVDSRPLSEQVGTDKPANGEPETVYQQDGVTVRHFGDRIGYKATAEGFDGAAWGASPQEARRALNQLVERSKPKESVLQNRDRSRPAYVEQMQSIAREPDYDRVSVSRDPNTGAPMVFQRPKQTGEADAPVVWDADKGNTDTVTMSDGNGGTRKVPVQYAVIEAESVTASNNADGSANDGYGRGGLTALNNGRTAGLQAAFENGTAEPYVEAMIADGAHGVSAEAIRAKKSPMLIRLFDESALEGIEDPGAASNVSASAELSAVEQAQTDARKMDPDLLSEILPGDVTGPSNIEFVRRATELLGKDGSGNSLRDAKGLLTADGHKRLKGALVERAYQDPVITQELTEAADNDLKTLGDALAQSAGRWALMREQARANAINPDMDITEALVSAINMIRKSRQEGLALGDLASQVDAFAGPADQMAVELLHLFYHGKTFGRIRAKDAIAQTLLDYVDAALASAPGPDMFGEMTTPKNVLEAHRGQSEGNREQEAAPGVQPDGSNDREVGAAGERSERRTGGQENAGEVSKSAPSSAGTEVETETEQDFDLQSQTEEELAKQELAREMARKSEAEQSKRDEQRVAADDQVNGFTLTGSSRTADVAMAAGQDDMLVQAQTSPPPKKPEFNDDAPANDAGVAVSEAIESAANDVDTNPSEAQKEAGNYQKGHVTIQGLSIAIENPKGSTRSGTDPDGNQWESAMAHHYGYIKRTEGADGDHVDVFIGPDPESDRVFVIDQTNADGTFDEHKVMIGFRNQAAARKGYRDNYEDGWKVGPTTRLSMDEFKAWLEDGDTTKSLKPAAETNSPAKGSDERTRPEDIEQKQQIEDFGEKIEGARKDYASKLAEAKEKDAASVPLSESWPEPDYQKLLDSGLDPVSVGFAHAARDEVPPKPRKGWKLKGWVRQVEALRNLSEALIDGDFSIEDLRRHAGKAGDEVLDPHVFNRADLYAEVGHSKSLKGLRFAPVHFSLYEGKEGSFDKWVIEQAAKTNAFGNMPRRLVAADTKEQAIDQFRNIYESQGQNAKPGKQTRFDIYTSRYDSSDIFIGKKIGRDVVRIRDGFDSVREAREYLSGNQESLELILNKMKHIPNHRKETNAPRVGVDHRNGGDVTPDAFSEAFGFRGVQFGNYVEQGRRQQDLNEAYDGLMDLAGILNIPARALSLNGELGLAFGARGKGGKGAPKAHYEPGNIVINLTKRDGAGSLAHEWFHALDNYFARERGSKAHMGYATSGQPHVSVRPEVAEAFGNLRKTVNRIRMRERSRKLDKVRTKAYWSTDVEMTARAFESYVIEKLKDQGVSNDYLANIVSEDYWKASEALGLEDSGSYPYPEAAEIPEIRAAYDHLFEVIETKESSDGSVALFSRGNYRRNPGMRTRSLSKTEADAVASEVMAGWKGRPPVTITEQIREFPEDLQRQIFMAGAESDMRAVFWKDHVYVLAPRIPDRAALEQVILHEVIGHYGLRKMLGPELKPVLNQVWLAAGGKSRAKSIIEAYFPDGSFDVNNVNHRHTVAEELIAHIAETKQHQKLWARIVTAIKNGLRRLGFKLKLGESDILDLLRGAQEVVEQGGYSRSADAGLVAGLATAGHYSRAGRSGSDRAAWPADFPRVPFAAPLQSASKHPKYEAAKAGDVEAARELVADIVSDESIQAIEDMLDGRRPTVVPVLADEATGHNKIPLAYAAHVAKALGLPVEGGIVQSVRAKRTGTGADHRLANHAVFDGEVAAGTEYLIVDDTMTMGGTLANLRGHIDANGGTVVGATTLTGFGDSGQLALTDKMRKALWAKHGKALDDYLTEEFGYGIDSLTQGEAGHFRKAVSLDAIRDRITAAGVDQGSGSSDESLESPRYSRTGARLEKATEHFTDLDDSQRDALNKIAPRTPKESARDWLAERTDRWQTKLRQGMVDRFAALMDVDEAVHGRDVIENSTASSSWVLAQMAGAASGALQSMLSEGRIRLDTKGKVIKMQDGSTKGLNETLKQLGSSAEIERFFGWIAGNRSARLIAEGRENLFSQEEVDALKRLNQGVTDNGRSRSALYAGVFKEFQQFRDDILGIAEQSGIITAEQRETWANEFYVPFYRLADNEGGFTGPKSSGGISRQQAYKRLKGGSQNLNDLLENTMMNFHHLLQASLKNQAAEQAVKNAEALGIARRVSESSRDTENSTFVLEDGVKAWYEIDDPLVFKAVTALAHPGMNSTAMKVMRGFKRLFTNLTTTTPQFVLANLLRDSMQASATSEVSKNMLKNMVQGSKAYGNKRTRAAMLASGGAFSFGHLYGENADEIRMQLTGGLAKADILRNPSFIPAAISGLWRRWNEVTDFTENVNRAAIFEQNRAEKGDLYAAFKARDLMNFSQHGAWPAVRILIDVVPFLNARLQGLDKIYRSGVKPGIRMAFGQGGASDKQAMARFWTVTGALALASLALFLKNRDDEEFQRLEEWQKDSYWFVRTGEDSAIFIPKPFEVGAIATLVERLTEQAVSDTATGELFAERLGHMLMDTFSFSPVPQMFQPALDVYANYDAFTDRPIESMGMERLSPSLRTRGNTSALAKGLGELSEAINGRDGKLTLSPVQIDHMIQGYFGSVGSWVVGLGDTIWKSANGETEPDAFWYEYQPIRRFYRNLGDEAKYTRYGTVFYDALKEANQVYADIREYQGLGQTEAAMDLLQENRQVLALRRTLNQVKQRLTRINQRMQQVYRMPADSEYKRRELDRLRAIRNRTQELVGRQIEQLNAASS